MNVKTDAGSVLYLFCSPETVETTLIAVCHVLGFDRQFIDHKTCEALEGFCDKTSAPCEDPANSIEFADSFVNYDAVHTYLPMDTAKQTEVEASEARCLVFSDSN